MAAPQVGVPLRLAVIEDRCRNPFNMPLETFREQERTPVRFHVIINPKITAREGSERTFFEGCLSVPGFRATVSRLREIQVEYLDENGECHAVTAHGWYARILQHEIDHLNGILYVDLMQTRTFMANEMFMQYWKEMSLADVIARLKIIEDNDQPHP